MKILSFRPSTKGMVGGHRPYNIDKGLQESGVDIRFVESFIPRRAHPSLFKAMSSDQNQKRDIIKKFSKEDGTKFFMVHGTYHRSATKYLAKFGIPMIFDFRDDPIWQYEAIDPPLDSKIKKKMKTNIDALMDASKYILFTSDSFLEHYPDSITEKAIIAPNAGDGEHFKSAPLPNNEDILSMGTPIPCYMQDVLIDACKMIKPDYPNMNLAMLNLRPGINSKNNNDEFAKKIQAETNDWITHFDCQPYSKIPDHFLKFFMATQLEHKNVYSDTHLPLKLFDFMAAGRPIVTTDCHETAKIIREENCGLVCDHTTESLAENMAKLLSDRKLAQKMGENGRKAIEEKHSWKHRAKTIIDGLSE